MSTDESSVQRSIKTPLRMAFVLEDQHLHQLDQILRTGNASVEYTTGSEALVFTTYKSVQGLIQNGNSPQDPIMRLEAKRVTPDTHVMVLLSNRRPHRYDTPVEFTIFCDDGRRPDFRPQMTQQLLDWSQQIKASPRRSLFAYRQGLSILLLTITGLLLLVGLFLELPWLAAGAVVVGLLLFIVALYVEGKFFPIGAFRFGGKRKREEM